MTDAKAHALSNSLYTKALSSGFPRSTSPMLSMPSPPMSPYSRLASTTPSSPATVVEDLPVSVSPKRFVTPSFEHVKRRIPHALPPVVKQQPHYKLPTPTPPPAEPQVTTVDKTANVNVKRTTEEYIKKLKEPALPPKRYEFGTYRLEAFNPAAPLASCCWDTLKSNPRAYLRRERAMLSQYSRHSPSAKSYIVTAHSSIRKTPRMSTRRRVYVSSESESMYTRSRKPRPAGVSDVAATALANAVSRPSTPRPSRPSTPKPRTPKPRPVASASRVHDLSTTQLVDYSPPVSSLPVGKSLRAEWKGAPMDLSQDPNLHLLHPAEVHLAAVLRLPADIYLDSKKRLFAEKVHRLRQGLPFRRTDSQKACRIDVNKASRLFSAFEKVGWLEDELFERFLN